MSGQADLSRCRPGDRIGRYEIRASLGRGDFATVFLAWDPELERQVALKVSHRPADGVDPAALLLREARLLAELQIPGILPIFEIEEHDGQRVLVLEYIEGGNLREGLLDPSLRLAPRQVAAVIAEVAEVLDGLHRRGYLHRNLRPQMVLLDGKGRPRLSGFEVALPTDGASGAFDSVVPSVETPPELAAEDAYPGPATDLWSLGVTFYQALSGRHPFEGGPSAEEGGIAPPPSRPGLDLPAELERICLRCLAPDPAERFATAAELARELRAWLSGEGSRRASRVFVSHSTQDRAFVEREVVQHLERNGLRTWYSRVDIRSAAEWGRSILRGLESCDWFTVVLSRGSAESEWVKDELHWAIDHRPRRIVPVIIEPCDPVDFHIRLARLQHVDLCEATPEARARLIAAFDRGADD